MPTNSATPEPDSRSALARLLDRPALAALALTVVALGVRIVALGSKSLWFDEALSIEDSLHAGRSFGSGFHPPLYYLVLRAWIALAGDSPTAVRLPSVLAGALTVPVTYLLGRRLFGPAAGLAAGLLLAVASLHVEYSQEARMYAIAGLFAAAAGLALAEALARSTADAARLAPSSRALWAWAAAATLCAYAAMATHYIAIFVVAGLALALFLSLPDAKPVTVRLAVLQAPAVAAAALLVAALGYGRALSVAAAFFAQGGGGNETIFDNPGAELLRLPVDLFMQILPGFGVKWLVLSPFYLVGSVVYAAIAVYGLVAVALRRDAARWRRALALVPGLAAVVVVAFMVGAGQLRFFVIAAPYILVAVGAGLARPAVPNAALRPAGAAALVVALALSSVACYRYLTFPLDKQPWGEVAARLARDARPGDVVLVSEPHMVIALRRAYAPGPGVDVEPFPEAGAARIDADNLELFLAPLVRGHDRVWFVRMGFTAARTDPSNLATKWLADAYGPAQALKLAGYNGDIELRLFAK